MTRAVQGQHVYSEAVRSRGYHMLHVLGLTLCLLVVATGARTLPASSSSKLLQRFGLSAIEEEALLEAVTSLDALQRLQAPSEQQLFYQTPRSGVPSDVACETNAWCDKAGVCTDVCSRGSVVQSPWQLWATKFQLNMARKQPLCYTQLLATHNSAITLADGYGNRDPLYSAYLRWLKTLGAATELQTNNQWLSLTDQLNLGVRVLELDVHFVAGELRIAHCGGLHSASLNRVVALINAVAKLLGRPEMTWDAETMGCSPSLSSIAVKDQRLLTDALEEIAAWMKQPSNSQELLVFFFDDQPDLATWNKVPELLEQLTRSFPEDWILTPSGARALMDARRMAGEPAPSIEELVGQGKRLLLLSGTDYGQEMEPLIFSNATMPALCPYAETWMGHFTGFSREADEPDSGGHALGSDVCFLSHHRQPEQHVALFDGTLERMPACELLYGPLDCHFRVGRHNEGLAMNDSDLAQVTSCGLNFPAPDLLTPARAAAHLWSWSEDHPPSVLLAASSSFASQPPGLYAAAGCTYAHAVDGRWRTGPCDDPASGSVSGPATAVVTVVACRSTTWDGADRAERRMRQRSLMMTVGHSAGLEAQLPGLWLLAPSSDCTPSPGGRDCCPAGFVHDAPHSAVENLLLRQALQAEQAGRALLPLWPPSYLPAWLQGVAASK